MSITLVSQIAITEDMNSLICRLVIRLGTNKLRMTLKFLIDSWLAHDDFACSPDNNSKFTMSLMSILKHLHVRRRSRV